MADSAKLDLPFVEASQAQKHVTVNEAFRRLDVFVNTLVKDRDLTAPPQSPSDGDTYIAAPQATGIWAGADSNVWAYLDGAWEKFVPFEGWNVWLEDESKLVTWNGSTWQDLSSLVGSGVTASELDDGTITTIGVNANADDTNRLSVNAPSVLFNRETDDINLTLNKDATADDARITFQKGFSTRALLGLLGDDNFKLQASNGTSFFDSIIAGSSNGQVDFPSGFLSPSNILQKLNFQYTPGNVDDNVALEVEVGTLFGGVILIIGNVSSAGIGLFYLRTAATVNIEEIFQIGSVINIVSGDGSLSGTTGSDGKLNIRADSSLTRSIWLENRTGSVRGYTVYVFR